MKHKLLGRTGLSVSENSFGALPIQRISAQEAGAMLNYALDQGINFIDTARAYTDSEEKIGLAIAHRREEYVLATKTMGRTKAAALQDLETSLRNLKTDHVDIWQLHCLPELPDVNDENSAFHALLEAKRSGKTRFIGVTTHRLSVALEAARCGLYDTVQFPLCYLASEEDLGLIPVCKQNNVGLIAMKGMSGGLISSPRAAYAFFTQYDNAVPIWGVQKQEELEDFLSFAREGVTLTPALESIIEKDKEELKGGFCRGCGYCMATCPAGIPISTAARMRLMLGRAPWQEYTTPEWIEKMSAIENCIHCNACSSRCPYELNTPQLLQENYAYFRAFCQEKGLL